jgi:hypothetical protein
LGAGKRPGKALTPGFALTEAVIALALSAGVLASGSALAEPAKFDGVWSVSLVADGGLCGSGTSSTLMVQNGSVRAGGAGVSVSGQVGPSGSVSLALQKSGVQLEPPTCCSLLLFDSRLAAQRTPPAT